MDGTYGNIFPASRAMSPAAPAQTSTSNLYKVNVNRQKTKKWANFKPQNYDGDDWGDDYDDPVQEADFPMPPKPLGPRSPATTAPVQPSVSSALPRGSAEPFGSSPQQHGSGLGRPRFPSDVRSGSPAPPTAHPLPSQLAQKSTIGANDVAGGYGAALESGAGSKPWMGSRSVSPSSPGQLSSRDKPLPLIHPQQMQEEKEGERQSLETRDNTKNDEGEPPGVSSPTAEKQSGYRSDGMLASSGKDRLNPESSRAEHEKSQDMPLPTSGNCIPESDEATATAAGASNQSITAPARERVVSSTETTTAAGAEAAPSPPSDRDQDQGRPAGLPSPRGAAESVHDVPEQQAPAADAARQPAASAEEQPTTLTARPHLPGGWVSETPSTPAGVVSPSTTGYSTNTLEKATEDSSRPDAVPLGVPRSQPRELEQDEKGDGSVPSRQTSPQTSSQPPAPAPVLNTEKLSMGSAQASPVATGHCDASPASETEDPKLFGNSTSAEAKTKHTEIAPTAPLNARRGTPDINANPAPVLSPPSPAEPVLDSATQSPVKDSDILSEEILRSLSPAQPASSPQTSTAAYQAAAAEPVRESSYLGDVYGDYWSATEEKAEPGLLQVGKTIDAGKAAQEAAPLPTKTPEDGGAAEPADAVGLGGLSSQAHAAPAKASDVVEPKSAFGVVGLQRRFSWEAPVQESPTASASSAAAELPVEQKSLGFGVDTTRALTTENISLETGESQPSQAQEEAGKSAEDLRAEFAPEFNPAATLGANLGLDRPSQSPSPASDSTSKHGEQKRLSLAEEKILLEEASSPSSRSPPLEQHPAFANSQQAPRAELPEAASPKSILGFRNIMELPSAAERIKHYNESRWHFSAVDTGLDEWLQAMILKHPEHANDVSSNAGAAAVVQQSSQGGRGPTLHMSNLQHSLSGLGHSGNQVGTKSKELLMAAGKASKGLFSKGRNKLRGTGDKVFSS